MAEQKQAEQSMGALWVKQGRAGEFMSGVIEIGDEKIPVVCFINKFKKSEKHPDWKIFKQRPRVESSEERQGWDRHPDAEAVAPEIADEDIPL